MNGACTSKKILVLHPWALGRLVVKRSNIIKLQLQSLFHRFLYQTFCVFLQIKDINVSKDIFVLMPGSCRPRNILKKALALRALTN